MKIGGRYIHPEDGLIVVIGGSYWGGTVPGEPGPRVSNFWTYTMAATGETKGDYHNREWPEA